MVFIYDTEMSLRAISALVNTLPECDFEGVDRLESVADLDAWLAVYPYTGSRRHNDAEVAEIRGVRARVFDLWHLDREAAVEVVNEMLRDASALPQLVRHDDYDWHIHAVADDEPLATRLLVEAAMAFVDIIRSDAYDRVRICEADDCEGVYIDFSKNGSKRYCDAGNCGNRMNVNAYRRRKARETA